MIVVISCFIAVSVTIAIITALAVDIDLLHNTLPVIVSKLRLLFKHQSILLTIRLTHHIIIHLLHICTHLIAIVIVIAILIVYIPLFSRHFRLNKHR